MGGGTKLDSLGVRCGIWVGMPRALQFALRARLFAARPQTTPRLVGLDRAARGDANGGIAAKIEALWVVEPKY